MKTVYLMNFLLAVSTAIGMSLLPIIAVDKLGVSFLMLGIIEGATEFLSNLFKLLSGNCFDRIKNKKKLFVLPVSIAFLSKLAVVLVVSKYNIFFSKIAERISNGSFGSVRDAFIIKHSKRKGLALSILNCSKTLGCVFGSVSLGAWAFFDKNLDNGIQPLLFLAFFVTSISLFLSFFVKEKESVDLKTEKFDFKEFKPVFVKLIPFYILTFIFFLGRFNDGLLMMFLKNKGYEPWFYLSNISFFNISMFIVSPLLGVLIDKKLANVVFYITIISLFIFNVLFYSVTEPDYVLASIGLICWGIQRAGAQIVFSYFVAKNTPTQFVGTAVGLLAVVNASGLLIASSTAGFFASTSFDSIFICSATTTLVALIFGKFFNTKLSN